MQYAYRGNSTKTPHTDYIIDEELSESVDQTELYLVESSIAN